MGALLDDAAVSRYLRGIASDASVDVAEGARRLARDAEYLTWAERPRVFDAFFWAEARARLSAEEVTAVVNRRRAATPGLYTLESYVGHCRGAVSGALLRLAEPARLTDIGAALTYRVSADPTHTELATDWLAGEEPQLLARKMRELPGYAFLVLLMSPSDGAASFEARDAFWHALLGMT